MGRLRSNAAATSALVNARPAAVGRNQCDQQCAENGQQSDPRLHGLSFRFVSQNSPGEAFLASASDIPTTYCCATCRGTINSWQSVSPSTGVEVAVNA